MDPYRVIGHRGKIPWHYSEDFQFFKNVTMGHNLLMGRNTFESIGKPLPGRFTYILTTDRAKLLTPPGTLACYVSGEWVRDQFHNNPEKFKNMWLCGGAKVYGEFLPLCSGIYVTHIIEEYEGDTYMPEFEHLFPDGEVVRETRNFWIARYWKENV